MGPGASSSIDALAFEVGLLESGAFPHAESSTTDAIARTKKYVFTGEKRRLMDDDDFSQIHHTQGERILGTSCTVLSGL